VISRNSPYVKRLSMNVTHGAVNTCSASAKSNPCLAKLLRLFASSHSYCITEYNDKCSYSQARKEQADSSPPWLLDRTEG